MRKEWAAIATAFLVTSGASWGSDSGGMRQPRYRDGVDECLSGSSSDANIELSKYNGNSLKQQGGAEKKSYETAEDGELSNVRQSGEEQPKKEPALKEIAETMLKKLSAWEKTTRDKNRDSELGQQVVMLIDQLKRTDCTSIDDVSQEAIESLYEKLVMIVANARDPFCNDFTDETLQSLETLRAQIYSSFS